MDTLVHSLKLGAKATENRALEKEIPNLETGWWLIDPSEKTSQIGNLPQIGVKKKCLELLVFGCRTQVIQAAMTFSSLRGHVYNL